MASPLVGYNTNVRHHGKLYHIQTEDSGAAHGHIFTHLFADGGRIIASKKTTYNDWLDAEGFHDLVKKLMRESHKAMFIALRDGLFDEDEAAGARAMAVMEIRIDGADDAAPAPSSPELDVDALERAASARLAESAARQLPPTPAPPPPAPRDTPPSPGRYSSTRPAAAVTVMPRRSGKSSHPEPPTESIFGGDLLSEKSLDEVILSYLAEDIDEDT